MACDDTTSSAAHDVRVWSVVESKRVLDACAGGMETRNPPVRNDDKPKE